MLSVIAVHKQRDVVPIDINDDVAESDEEEPVFGFQVIYIDIYVFCALCASAYYPLRVYCALLELRWLNAILFVLILKIDV